jgi:hypothetical protein
MNSTTPDDNMTSQDVESIRLSTIAQDAFLRNHDRVLRMGYRALGRRHVPVRQGFDCEEAEEAFRDAQR